MVLGRRDIWQMSNSVNVMPVSLSNVFEDYGVKINQCFGIGSDGASVMTGHENGVAAILKRENPYLIAIHCVAHKLALATSQAAANISTVVQYCKTLSAIYSHFLHSTVHHTSFLLFRKC